MEQQHTGIWYGALWFFGAMLAAGMVLWQPVAAVAETPLPVVGMWSKGHHTCVLLEVAEGDRRVKCWGRNNYGQLGIGVAPFLGSSASVSARHAAIGDQAGEMGDKLPFVDLGSDVQVQSLAVGYFHTCALLTDGRVKCWGLNTSGEIGLGDDSWSKRLIGDTPEEMGDGLPFIDFGKGLSPIELTAGGFYTCALFKQGRIKCWGFNGHGELGLENIEGDRYRVGDQPQEMGDQLPFVNLGAGMRVRSLSAGRTHTCVLLENGRVKCWGLNDWLQLGSDDPQPWGDAVGEMGDKLPFVPLGGLRVTRLYSGDYFSCALSQQGRIKCWGRSSQGLLGGGINKHSIKADDAKQGWLVPAKGQQILQVAGGWLHACAILTGGKLKCWGDANFGLLGRLESKLQPLSQQPEVMVGGPVSHLALGERHTCVLIKTPQGQRAKCWGRGLYGLTGYESRQRLGDKPDTIPAKLPFIKLGNKYVSPKNKSL